MTDKAEIAQLVDAGAAVVEGGKSRAKEAAEAAEAAAAAAAALADQTAATAVSYTHLTLPTIYSV